MPDPRPGEALVVERYSTEHVKAVILHSDDFAELQGGSELLDDSTVSQIVDGLRKGGDAEFEFVVRAKARPVLLLSGRSDPRTGDLFALRLLRLKGLIAPLAVAGQELVDPAAMHSVGLRRL